MNNTAPLLDVSGLTKRFSVKGRGPKGEKRFVHAVDNVSFTLPAAKSSVLWGNRAPAKPRSAAR